jgi:uncharacterized membrane protein
MRKLHVGLLLLLSLLCAPAWAKYSGLSLSTEYPDQTVQAGRPVVVPLSVHNYGLAPQEVALTVAEAPPGWKAEFEGGARQVGAVFVAPDESQEVSLHLTPPASATRGSFRFRLVARGRDRGAQFRLNLHLAKTIPNWLTMSASLPTLKGSSSTNFSYDIKLDNKSGHDAMVNLSAQAPDGFDVSFTPQYGSQQVTSMRVKAGASKDVSAKVSLPDRVQAGKYGLTVHAASGKAGADLPLTMIVTGKPEISVTTPTGRLSGTATVGHTTQLALEVVNNGSAPARDVKLAADSPSHWKVSFDPESLGRLAPHQKDRITASITPAARSLAGDYMLTLQANGDTADASADYRVTVMTSTLWGSIGVGIAAAAILVVGFAVSKFGRR